MSLILDALKRAERERQAERNPVLGDVAPTPALRAPSRWRLIVVGLAVVVTALVAAGTWYALRERPADVAAPATPTAPEPEAVAEPEPAPEADLTETETETETETAPEPAVVPGTETVTSLEDLTSDTEAPPTPPLPEASGPATTPMPAPAQPQAVAPAPETPPADGAAASETPSTGAAPAAESRPLPPALTQPAPRRKLREMPPEYRADFPALTVEVHVYERDAARRFVIVNGRRYREGERLQDGPLLVEIAKEGLVLEYRGETVLFTLGR